MKRKSTRHSGHFNLRLLLGFVLCLAGISFALLAFGVFSGAPAQAQVSKQDRAAFKSAPPITTTFHQ